MQPFRVPQLSDSLGGESFGQVPGSDCPPDVRGELTVVDVEEGTFKELEGACVLFG